MIEITEQENQTVADFIAFASRILHNAHKGKAPEAKTLRCLQSSHDFAGEFLARVKVRLETGKLDDDSPMPFGEHKGVKMEKVPASYLHWLWSQRKPGDKRPIFDYISRNIGALKKEHPDGVW